MKHIIEDIATNIDYINKKDPYNIYALQSLQYLKEQLKEVRCENCEHSSPDGFRFKPCPIELEMQTDIPFDFGCNKFERKEKEDE